MARDEKTCTIEDLENTPENFAGFQIFDDALLSSLIQKHGNGRKWECTLIDNDSSTMIDVVVEPQLGQKLADHQQSMKKLGRRWKVIVTLPQNEFGHPVIEIVELEIYTPDGHLIGSYN